MTCWHRNTYQLQTKYVFVACSKTLWMYVFVRRRSAAEEFNRRPVLPCTDVLLPQRKTWWWGWLNKLWAASTPQAITCRPLRRFMLYRGFTARRSTCHGESQRARGQVKPSHLYLVPKCKKKQTFSPTYVCLTVCSFSFHTEVTRFPKRTSQVTVWYNRVIYYCTGTICPCLSCASCSFFFEGTDRSKLKF